MDGGEQQGRAHAVELAADLRPVPGRRVGEVEQLAVFGRRAVARREIPCPVVAARREALVPGRRVGVVERLGSHGRVSERFAHVDPSRTSWVCVTTAQSLPSSFLIEVCQTIVVRPRCRARHSPVTIVSRRAPAMNLVLESVVVVRLPGARLSKRSDRAQRVGEGHVGAAVKDAAGRAQIGTDLHLGDDPIGCQRADAHAHQAGKERIEQRLDGSEIGHRVSSRRGSRTDPGLPRSAAQRPWAEFHHGPVPGRRILHLPGNLQVKLIVALLAVCSSRPASPARERPSPYPPADTAQGGRRRRRCSACAGRAGVAGDACQPLHRRQRQGQAAGRSLRAAGADAGRSHRRRRSPPAVVELSSLAPRPSVELRELRHAPPSRAASRASCSPWRGSSDCSSRSATRSFA